jgi:hypothetical protein
MGTTDTAHMLLVVALEVLKIAIIVTVTTATQRVATTIMIVVIMIDGTVVEDDATKTKHVAERCEKECISKPYIGSTNDNTLKKNMQHIGTNFKWCSLGYC